MRKIVFATNNNNKLKEIQSLLKNQVEIQSLSDIGFNEEIDETENTLEGNSLLKSKAIYDRFNCDVFADDTGLEIEALNGEPGVYSARYADKNSSNAEANMAKVLDKMTDITNRKAQFRTVISLILDDKEYAFEGIVQGCIIEHRQGDDGFGYDPIFRPDGYDETFAQLPMEVKNKISHRGLAVQKLVEFLKEYSK